MKKYDKSNCSQISLAKGKKLITCRNIEEEMTDPYCRIRDQYMAIPDDLRHFGRCQRITILDYTADDYTQDDMSRTEQNSGQPTPTMVPHTYLDLRHAPMIKFVDLSRFDGKPGSIITILPKTPVKFVKVTVRICDLFNRELVHGHAWDVDDLQEWTFSYFPQHKFNPEPRNLQILICASEKQRMTGEPLVDLYELTPDKLRERVLCIN